MYPIQLNLSHKCVAIIGGGRIALRKFNKLQAYDVGRVIVISPHIDKGFYEHCSTRTEFRQKAYEAEDIKDADLIFIATNDVDVNNQVAQDAMPHQWVNHTGDRTQSDFYNMATTTCHDVQISMHSDGQNAPLVKQRIAQFRAMCNEINEGED